MNMNMPWNNNKSHSTGIAGTIEDVKRSLSQEVDHLAQLAAQTGRDIAAQTAKVTQDAGTQAALVARDLGSQAARASQDAGAQAAAVARDVPVGASTLAQQAARGAAQLGRDLRNVRITREPAAPQRGPDLMPGVALLAGFGSGIALMYFFDPEKGRQRRNLLRDQIAKWTRIGQRTATGKAGDLRNRTIGLAHEARRVVTGVSDQQTETDELAGGIQSRMNANGAYVGNGQSDYGQSQSEVKTTEQPTQPMHSEVS